VIKNKLSITDSIPRP